MSVSEEKTKMKKRRAKNFTSIEQSTLIELLNPQRMNIIENKSTHGPMVQRKINAWKAIEEEFNAIGVGQRSSKELKEFWRRTKQDAKKTITEKKKECRGTGGGPSRVEISPLTERVLIFVCIFG